MKDVVKGSAMRLNLILAAVGAFILMLSASAYIIIAAFKGIEPSWEAMALFAVGIASILTGVGWNKTKQKEIEVKNENKV